MKTPLTKQIENQQSELNRLRDRLMELARRRRPRRGQTSNSPKQLPDMIDAASQELDPPAEHGTGAWLPRRRRAPDEPAASQEIIVPEASGRSPCRRRRSSRPIMCSAPPRPACGRSASRSRSSVSSGKTTAMTKPRRSSRVRPSIRPRPRPPAMRSSWCRRGFGAFMDRLLANSIYGPLSAAGARYDLGRNGSLKIPYRATTPLASGAWVGEGAPKPVKSIGLSTVDTDAAQDLLHHRLYRGNGNVLGAGDRGHPAQGDGRRHPGLARRLPDRRRGRIGNAAGRSAGWRHADHRLGGGDIAGEDRRRHQCADRADGGGRRRRQCRPADEPGAGAQDRHGA